MPEVMEKNMAAKEYTDKVLSFVKLKDIKVPTVAIMGEDKIMGYLRILQDYRFEVTEFIDGENILGCSEIVSLGSIITALKEAEVSELKTIGNNGYKSSSKEDLSSPTILAYVESALLRFSIHPKVRNSFVLPMWGKDYQALTEFVKDSIDYIADNM
jgi:hypothetical protein